jgi:hypothetical protein
VKSGSPFSSGPAIPTAAPAAPAAAAAPAARASDAASASKPSATGQSSGSTSDKIPPLQRMVIRNAKLTLQVQDVERALQTIRDVADTSGGYVSASHTSYVREGDQDRMVADVTIAVRSDVYDRAVQSIRQVATKVESEDGTSQDVTEEYVDLDAQLRNLQASEDSLLKLTQQATRLEDILTLQRELANVRGQIERIQGRQRFLEHNTDMSTISITLHLPPLPAPPPPPVVKPVWNPLATFDRGWQASLVALESLADVAISIVSFGWWLTPPVILAYAVLRNRRRGATPTIIT